MLASMCFSMRLRDAQMTRQQTQGPSRWLALPFPDQTVGRVDLTVSSKSGPKAGQFSDVKGPPPPPTSNTSQS